jgi:hypothetical protein
VRTETTAREEGEVAGKELCEYAAGGTSRAVAVFGLNFDTFVGRAA